MANRPTSKYLFEGTAVVVLIMIMVFITSVMRQTAAQGGLLREEELAPGHELFPQPSAQEEKKVHDVEEKIMIDLKLAHPQLEDVQCAAIGTKPFTWFPVNGPPEEIKIRAEFAAHLDSLSPIPKRIHMSWMNPNVLTSKSDLVREGLAKLVSHNPDWEFKLYTDAEVISYCKEHLPKSYFDLLKDHHIIEMLDVWRMLVVYFEGGFYMDMDRLFNKPFSKTLGESLRLSLPTHYNVNFAQDMLLTSPCNDMMRAAIQRNYEQRLKHKEKGLDKEVTNRRGLVLELGPANYLHTVLQVVFGFDIPDDNLGDGLANKVRVALHNSPRINTYKEVWCDSLYHSDDECKTLSRGGLWEADKKGKTWDDEVAERAKGKR